MTSKKSDDEQTTEAAAEGTPAEEATPPVASDETEKRGLLSSFLKLSGYSKRDITAFNREARTVVTSNGGKYKVSASGRQLKVLSGPQPPGAEE